MNLSEDNQFICLYRMAKDCDSLQSGRIFRRIASTGLLSNATELCSVQHSWRILFFLDGAGFKKSLEQSERGWLVWYRRLVERTGDRHVQYNSATKDKEENSGSMINCGHNGMVQWGPQICTKSGGYIRNMWSIRRVVL